MEKIEGISTETDFSRKQVIKANDEQLILNREASEKPMSTEVDKEVNGNIISLISYSLYLLFLVYF